MPIMFIPKKEGKLYLYINYYMLNRFIYKNHTLLPLILEILNSLLGAKVYIKLDLKEVYYRLRIYIGNK
jgi:hypothetical protein